MMGNKARSHKKWIKERQQWSIMKKRHTVKSKQLVDIFYFNLVILYTLLSLLHNAPWKQNEVWEGEREGKREKHQIINKFWIKNAQKKQRVRCKSFFFLPKNSFFILFYVLVIVCMYIGCVYRLIAWVKSNVSEVSLFWQGRKHTFHFRLCSSFRECPAQCRPELFRLFFLVGLAFSLLFCFRLQFFLSISFFYYFAFIICCLDAQIMLLLIFLLDFFCVSH